MIDVHRDTGWIHERPHRSVSLSWEDLKFLSENSWGLRNVSRSKAHQEMKKGVENGDALALSAPLQLLNRFEVSDPILRQTIDTLPVGLVSSGHLLTVSEREKLLQRYQDRVRAFMYDKLLRGINSSESALETTHDIFSRMKAVSSFIIGEFKGAKTPIDRIQYYGLGKCGAQTVPAKNLLVLIEPDEDFPQENTAITHQDMKSNIAGELTNYFWKKFVSDVQSRRHLAKAA